MMLVHEIERLKGDLDEIIESMDNGLIATDTNGVVFTFNRAAERALGISREEVVGSPLNDVLDRGGRTMSRALVEGTARNLEVTAVRPDDQTVHLRGSVTPLLDREGQTISGVSFGRGVKDQSKMWVRNHEGDFLFVEKETFASFQSALDQIEALLR